MRAKLSAQILSIAALAVLFAALAEAQSRPNVVLIMTDDAGYGDLGVYGATDLRTPNLGSARRWPRSNAVARCATRWR